MTIDQLSLEYFCLPVSAHKYGHLHSNSYEASGCLRTEEVFRLPRNYIDHRVVSLAAHNISGKKTKTLILFSNHGYSEALV